MKHTSQLARLASVFLGLSSTIKDQPGKPKLCESNSDQESMLNRLVGDFIFQILTFQNIYFKIFLSNYKATSQFASTIYINKSNCLRLNFNFIKFPEM